MRKIGWVQAWPVFLAVALGSGRNLLRGGFGILVVVSFYFPERGVQVGAVVLFLLMCALAPSGYYKFISERTTRNE